MNTWGTTLALPEALISCLVGLLRTNMVIGVALRRLFDVAEVNLQQREIVAHRPARCYSSSGGDGGGSSMNIIYIVKMLTVELLPRPLRTAAKESIATRLKALSLGSTASKDNMAGC